MNKLDPNENVISEFTHNIADDSYRLITEFVSSIIKDEKVVKHYTSMFLFHYICSLINARLATPAKKNSTKAQRVQHIMDNFKGIKQDVEKQVAAAFTSTVQTTSGPDITYCCGIYAMPDSINKQPC